MLRDNSIMNAFGGVLDWNTEQLSFKTVKTKLSQCRVNVTQHLENSAIAQSSVESVNTGVEHVPVI